jgi:phosphopantetheinyl transferase (holo-ACP synthase)
MIGIDVVDLKDPLIKSRDPETFRFIVPTNDQIELIRSHPFGFWIIWTAKESVFKALRKDIRFDPLQIPVQFSASDTKYFTFQSGAFSGKVYLSTEYVLACCGPVTYKVVERKSGTPSMEVRTLLMQDYLRETGNGTTIGTIDKMPVLLPSEKPVSFSHHGRFLAYAYPLN